MTALKTKCWPMFHSWAWSDWAAWPHLYNYWKCTKCGAMKITS